MKQLRAVLFLIIMLWALPANATIEEVVSPGGIKAWLVQDSKLPLISMQFAFRGGVEQDPSDKQGLTELTVNLLTEGAGKYDSAAFQQALADNSIAMQFNVGRDAIFGEIKTLKMDQNLAFDLLHLAVTNPRFDGDEINRQRDEQLTSLKIQLGSPDWQARYALFSYLFAGHPYGERMLGTAASLNSLKREDLQNFAAKHFARDNLIIAVTGDISREELAATLDRVFGDLPLHAQLAPIDEVKFPQQPQTILVPREGTQTEMMFAMPGPKRTDADWYAADIVNYILGSGGFSSRLMHEVRDKRGLTYGINTMLSPMEHAGIVVGEAATDNPKVGQAWSVVMQVWQGIYHDGVTEDEVNAAKDYLTGALPLAMTSTDKITAVLVDLQMNHLGQDYLEKRNSLIRGVTPQDIQDVIHRWFDPEKLTVVMVGQPQGITPTETWQQVRE